MGRAELAAWLSRVGEDGACSGGKENTECIRGLEKRRQECSDGRRELSTEGEGVRENRHFGVALDVHPVPGTVPSLPRRCSPSGMAPLPHRAPEALDGLGFPLCSAPRVGSARQQKRWGRRGHPGTGCLA